MLKYFLRFWTLWKWFWSLRKCSNLSRKSLLLLFLFSEDNLWVPFQSFYELLNAFEFDPLSYTATCLGPRERKRKKNFFRIKRLCERWKTHVFFKIWMDVVVGVAYSMLCCLFCWGLLDCKSHTKLFILLPVIVISLSAESTNIGCVSEQHPGEKFTRAPLENF